jgi:hypothetical protein
MPLVASQPGQQVVPATRGSRSDVMDHRQDLASDPILKRISFGDDDIRM